MYDAKELLQLHSADSRVYAEFHFHPLRVEFCGKFNYECRVVNEFESEFDSILSHHVIM